MKQKTIYVETLKLDDFNKLIEAGFKVVFKSGKSVKKPFASYLYEKPLFYKEPKTKKVVNRGETTKACTKAHVREEKNK